MDDPVSSEDFEVQDAEEFSFAKADTHENECDEDYLEDEDSTSEAKIEEYGLTESCVSPSRPQTAGFVENDEPMPDTEEQHEPEGNNKKRPRKMAEVPPEEPWVPHLTTPIGFKLSQNRGKPTKVSPPKKQKVQAPVFTDNTNINQPFGKLTCPKPFNLSSGGQRKPPAPKPTHTHSEPIKPNVWSRQQAEQGSAGAAGISWSFRDAPPTASEPFNLRTEKRIRNPDTKPNTTTQPRQKPTQNQMTQNKRAKTVESNLPEVKSTRTQPFSFQQRTETKKTERPPPQPKTPGPVTRPTKPEIIKPQTQGLTVPRSPNLVHKGRKGQADEAPRPTLYQEAKPFIPQLSEKLLTEPVPFNFSTDTRGPRTLKRKAPEESHEPQSPQHIVLTPKRKRPRFLGIAPDMLHKPTDLRKAVISRNVARAGDSPPPSALKMNPSSVQTREKPRKVAAPAPVPIKERPRKPLEEIKPRITHKAAVQMKARQTTTSENNQRPQQRQLQMPAPKPKQPLQQQTENAPMNAQSAFSLTVPRSPRLRVNSRR